MSTPDLSVAQIYDTCVLSVDVVQGIIEKEHTRGYPLDRLNDMRALINYAPYYVRQWLPNLPDLYLITNGPQLMSAGRLLRLHQAFPVALGVDIRLGNDWPPELVDAIRTLGVILVDRMQGYPASESMVSTDSFLPENAMIQPRTAAIGWKAAELADRLGMGEHVLFAHCPVQTGHSPPVVTRSLFYQRRSSDFPHHLVVATQLRIGTSYEHVVPVYRSRALSAIPPEGRVGNYVFVDDEPVTDPATHAAVEDSLTTALHRVCEREEDLSRRVDLDYQKMTVYSAELRDVLAGRGQRWRMPVDAAEAIVKRRVTRELGFAEDDSYAGLFFELTREGLVALRTPGAPT